MCKSQQQQETGKQHLQGNRKRRKGAVLVLTALLMIVMLAMLAFSIDVGYVMMTQAEIQRSVDAAALAGAGVLVDGEDVAQERVIEYLVRNPVGEKIAFSEELLQQRIAEFKTVHVDDYTIDVGHWDAEATDPTTGLKGVMSLSSVLPSTIRVQFTKPDRPLFFASVLGRKNFNASAETIAMYQPRDIVLVLDLSASMNDDSELKSINSLGRETVEANLYQIWEDLGSPTYGNMQFEPQYYSTTSTYWIKYYLGLNNVPYPYNSGSWDSYIEYCKDYYNANYYAGYRKQYGYLNLMHYWLENKPSASQTADLWKVSAQPITAVKDSVDVFMDYIQAVDTDDRVGLAVYNAPDGEGKLELSLTNDFEAVKSAARARQAGHYHSMTNIGAGIHTGIQELSSNGRLGAFKMIVLMTDGQANYYNGNSSTSQAEQYVSNQAAIAAGLKYPIVTISLGSGADTSIMQEVADATEGTHFNVPGGQSVDQYRENLMQVFQDIADDRPLKIVR